MRTIFVLEPACYTTKLRSADYLFTPGILMRNVFKTSALLVLLSAAVLGGAVPIASATTLQMGYAASSLCSGSQTFSTAGSTAFVVPTNCEITLTVKGAGGGATTEGSGGAGGEVIASFSSGTVSGQTLTIDVGAGGLYEGGVTGGSGLAAYAAGTGGGLTGVYDGTNALVIAGSGAGAGGFGGDNSTYPAENGGAGGYNGPSGNGVAAPSPPLSATSYGSAATASAVGTGGTLTTRWDSAGNSGSGTSGGHGAVGDDGNGGGGYGGDGWLGGGGGASGGGYLPGAGGGGGSSGCAASALTCQLTGGAGAFGGTQGSSSLVGTGDTGSVLLTMTSVAPAPSVPDPAPFGLLVFGVALLVRRRK